MNPGPSRTEEALADRIQESDLAPVDQNTARTPSATTATSAMPASRSMGLWRNHSSRFLTAPHFRSPFMFWCPLAASNPYSISNTPNCTISAVDANVGRFGAALISFAS